MNRTDGPDAWNLLFVTTVNVCYWKRLIELYEKWCRRAQYCASGIGLTTAIIVYIANRDWVTTVIPAISGFLIAVIGVPLAKLWRTGEGKKGHERWSQLCSDADVLWRHGEKLGWDDPDITARGAQLAERQKQYQAHEYHNPKTAVLEKCEALARSQLTSRYRTEEH
ncbi:MAG: hypothetical protein V3W34_17990 [Phycisphaerae bacterium]